MSRPVFIMDFGSRQITDLGREHNDDPTRYSLQLSAEEAATLRKPRAVITSPSGRHVWEFVDLTKLPEEGMYLLRAHLRVAA